MCIERLQYCSRRVHVSSPCGRASGGKECGKKYRKKVAIAASSYTHAWKEVRAAEAVCCL